MTVRKPDVTLVKVRRPIASLSEAARSSHPRKGPKQNQLQRSLLWQLAWHLPFKATKSDTEASIWADGAEESRAVGPVTVGTDKPKAGDGTSDLDKQKQTYKITAEELSDIEQAVADKVTEKKLNHHWANLTFYLMASLSIILSSLFTRECIHGITT